LRLAPRLDDDDVRALVAFSGEVTDDESGVDNMGLLKTS